MAELGLFEAMSTTRSVRRLRIDPVPDAAIRRIIEAATWAPTGGNAQPWRVVVVRDAAKKIRMQELYLPAWEAYAAGHRGRLEQMAEAVRAAQLRMLAAADHLARHLHEVPVILVFCFNPSLMAIVDANLGRPSVVGGASLYPAVQNALLAARGLGLGCVLTTLLCAFEDEVKTLLSIPDDWYTCAHVPIGYPERRGHGPLTRRSVDSMAFADTWGEPLA
jgi:nitroreductase